LRPATAEIAVAKAAQRELVRHLAVELAGSGIRVNVVARGMVPTGAHGDGDLASLTSSVRQATPTGRVNTPEDIGDVVVAFAGDLTRQVTGACVVVDGGMTMP
jgi:3-oxoacyl-[acyl-carrier protein] reductase